MRPIERTSCQGIQPFPGLGLVEHLAALIDGRTEPDMTSGGGCGTTAPAKQAGSALIWVEGEQDRADDHGRGIIVVGHGPDPATAARSSVISFPVGANDGQHCLHAVSNALRAFGWSVAASTGRKTATGRANTAVLVNRARPAGEQRLFLAEPIQATRQQPVTPDPQPRGGPQ